MRARSLVLAVAALASSTTLAAQECVGIPKDGRGFFAAGPSGSDGASGTGITFAYQRANGSVTLAHQSLGVFAYANQQKTTFAQGSLRVQAIRGCLTVGLRWQDWDTERNDNRSWSIDDPGVIVERHGIGGAYKRLRIPVGVSFGRTISWKSLSAVPYVNPFAVLELEDFQSDVPTNDAPSQSGSSTGGGLETGLAFRAGWFVARSSIAVTNTRDRALSGKRNWADLALHFGVVF